MSKMGKKPCLGSMPQSQSDSNFSPSLKITSSNKRHKLKNWTTYIAVNTRALSEDVKENESEPDKETMVNVDNTNTTNTATNSTSTPTTEENKE